MRTGKDTGLRGTDLAGGAGDQDAGQCVAKPGLNLRKCSLKYGPTDPFVS